MLLGLKISNMAVIEEAEVSFGPGLTVLTGETGAGKSILIDALGLLLGVRADGEVIRAGYEEASVEAVFAKTPAMAIRLASLGLPDLGEEVSLRRVVSRQTRGKVYINGALVTVGVLGRLMRGCLDISGQHEYVSAFDPCLHRTILDRFGKLEPLVTAYQQDFKALKEMDQRIAELGEGEQQVHQRMEFLRFQLEEIERLHPAPAEDAQLEQERRRLSQVEKLRGAATFAEGLLSSQDAASLETLGRAISALSDSARLDPALEAIADSLRTAMAEVEEATRGLSRYLHNLELDPRRLAEVEERLDSLRRVCRKHGCDLETLRARGTDLANELHALENRRVLLDELRPKRERAEAAARRTAHSLSTARAEAAHPLGEAVRDGLSRLAMEKAAFDARLSQSVELGPEGLDQVEFLFSANPGEPPRPLSRVASGGESSRLLLALKQALASVDECSCYVLDEADAGVGGAVAEVVGRMIREISMHRQVLFITHLPQVAAYADTHLVIEKRLDEGRTVSKVVRLDSPDARTEELARMLSGLKVTSQARGAAEALVRSAHRSLRSRRRGHGEVGALPASGGFGAS